MAKANKTHRTTLPRQAGASVSAFLDTHPKEAMRDDGRVLMAMMQEPA